MADSTTQMEFSLSNLKHLDLGRVNAAFSDHIARVTKDCMDRPGDKTARTITLTVAVKPVIDTKGTTIHCNDVTAECKVNSSVPDMVSKPYTMKTKHDGRLAFQPESPEDASQESLPYRDRPQD